MQIAATWFKRKRTKVGTVRTLLTTTTEQSKSPDLLFLQMATYTGLGFDGRRHGDRENNFYQEQNVRDFHGVAFVSCSSTRYFEYYYDNNKISKI